MSSIGGGGALSTTDILQFIDSKLYKQINKENIDPFKVYLNPQKYSSSEGYGSSLFDNLSKDLSFCAVKCCYNVVHNRSRLWTVNGIKMVRFVCTRYRKFRSSTRCIDNSEFNFRYHSFHNDKKNSGGNEGMHSQRKTWTKQAITNLKDACPFYFYVTYDCDSFLLYLELVLRNVHTITNKSLKEYFII